MRQNLCFQGPHDPFVCPKDKREIILRRLGRCGPSRLSLIRTMLNVEWFESRHEMADSSLDQLGYRTFQIVEWFRKVDVGKLVGDKIVTLPNQFQQLNGG